MLDLSPIKLLVIVAVILILLGPDKLPETAHQIGAAWRSLRKWRERIEQEVRDVVPDLPSSGDLARIARSPVNLLNTLADRVTAGDEKAAGPTLVHEDQHLDSDTPGDAVSDTLPNDDPSEHRVPWTVPPMGDPSLN